MNNNMIPEATVVLWEEKESNVCIQVGNNKIILNITASVVWKCIDGLKTIGEIIEEIYAEYKETDSLQTVTNVVEEALELFEKENLIKIRDTMDFDGWLQYD